jgi:fructose-specific phosphotransferase system IIC component
LGVFTGVNPIVVLAVAAATAICVAWGLVLGGHKLRSRIVKSGDSDTKATTRTRLIVDRFGPIGLGLIGPVFPGVIASSLSGVAVGADSKRLGIWLTVGIGLWFSLFTVVWWGVRQGLFR